MTISRGSVAILLVAICLSPSSALPDFLAPFRSMLGMKHQPQTSSSSNSPYSKPLSSPKDPSASHVHKHFGSGGGGGPQEDPFNSNFGFGSPPSPNHEYSPGGPPPSHGGGQGHHSHAPHSSGVRGNTFRPISGVSRPVRQQPGSGYRPGFGPSQFAGGRPSPSSSPFGGGPSHAPRPTSSRDHHPHPGGPPTGFKGSVQDDSGPYKYQEDDEQSGPPSGPSSFSPDGPSSSPQYLPSLQGRPGRPGRPPSFSPQGPPSSSPYQGGRPSSGGRGSGAPFSSFSNDGPPSHGGEDGPQGPGFSGFGSFPGGDEDESSPPRGGPRGPPRGGEGSDGPPSFEGYDSGDDSPKPFRQQSSRPPYESSSSDPPSGFSQGGGPPGSGSEDDGPSSFFAASPGGGGGSEYPEQYQDAPRGTRNPEIISSNGVNKYPPQLAEDDEPQGPPQGYGDYRRGPPFRGGSRSGPPSSPLQQPSSNPGSGATPWEQQGPSPTPYGSPEDGPSSSQSTPTYQPRRRHPSSGGNGYASSTYPRPRPVGSGGYQPSEMAQHSNPMMMSASSTSTHKTKTPRRQRKRFSSKIVGPPVQPQTPAVGQRIIPLVSPRDPNYQASSLSTVTAPFEPDTAATEHGHGGHEGLSNNGDRILYHVGGHKGPHSYRFGYDTGKGYNRLFRFEEKDGKGYVKGKYGFYDKQGKLQVVNYEAHPKHGFHAERAHAHQ